ncbi:MAG: GCN5-related N-acetyltransferase [Pseudonocardia sp.]|nr:GCN5-related N-acetyltransferase [Pseudonocardia sp.]
MATDSDITEEEYLATGWEDDAPRGDTVVRNALRAMADRLAAWADAAGGRVHREDGLVLTDAASPNLFINQALVARRLDEELARRVVEFYPAERPMLLMTPRDTPDLRPTGLALMGHPPFMVRAAGGEPPPLPAGVTVHEVTTPDELAVWDGVVADGFPMPLSPAPPSLLGGPSRFWLAMVDGQPAGASAAATDHGVTDVEAVATLPAYRGRGVGAAVTWAATLADRAVPAVLIASDLGRGVYERMGYLAVMRWTLWYRE